METKEEKITAYKGFDKNLQCRGFQYEIGKEYELPEGETPNVCERGFHACENPSDLYAFYSPAEGNRFCLVELSGIIDKSESDKTCASRIKILRELTLQGLIDARLKYVQDHIIEPANPNGASSATGYRGASSATGDYGASSATGDYGASSATGNCGASSTTGDYGASSVGGYDSIALAAGYKCKAKGSLGCWLVIAERDEYDGENNTYPIKDVKAVKVDGERIKADTWYMLVDGEFKEV